MNTIVWVGIPQTRKTCTAANRRETGASAAPSNGWRPAPSTSVGTLGSAGCTTALYQVRDGAFRIRRRRSEPVVLLDYPSRSAHIGQVQEPSAKCRYLAFSPEVRHNMS